MARWGGERVNGDGLRHLARRTSISLIPAAHSVWIHGSLASQFDAARPTLQVLAKVGTTSACSSPPPTRHDALLESMFPQRSSKSAAALRLEQITIGGMDLLLHPAGRYPNNIQTRNEYARVHTRENELAMIDLALRDFQGEVTILSEILRNSLEEYRETQREQAAMAASVRS